VKIQTKEKKLSCEQACTESQMQPGQKISNYSMLKTSLSTGRDVPADITSRQTNKLVLTTIRYTSHLHAPTSQFAIHNSESKTQQNFSWVSYELNAT
jgi:hypothetical protein